MAVEEGDPQEFHSLPQRRSKRHRGDFRKMTEETVVVPKKLLREIITRIRRMEKLIIEIQESEQK